MHQDRRAANKYCLGAIVSLGLVSKCEKYLVGVRIRIVLNTFEDRQIVKEEDYPTAGRYIL
jgi:hypothetical protein